MDGAATERVILNLAKRYHTQEQEWASFLFDFFFFFTLALELKKKIIINVIAGVVIWTVLLRLRARGRKGFPPKWRERER